MESNGLPGGMFSGMGSGMLGLEMPLHQSQQQQQQNTQNPHQLHHHQHPKMVAFAQHEADHNHHQPQQSVKHGFTYATKAKQQQLALSDEDEPGFTADDSAGDGKRKVSPWQRMKWTDSMVKLLIMAVFYIGDEGGSDGTDPATTAGKKKVGGLLQKKGKWKSVSRAMMEKGFYVSPQQCEDKFNDLNKRYKRVNDILGKGTACQVVENQSLLDTMDHLSPKMKEEVRKLLNSKHLFFREMCAYHNSCGGGGGGNGGAAGAHHSPDMTTEPSNHQQRQQQQQQQQQRCFHSSENSKIVPNLGRVETEGLKMVKGGSGEDDEEDEEDDEDDDEEDEEEEVEGGGGRGQNEHGHEDDGDNSERSVWKRQRKETLSLPSPVIQQLSSELIGVLQDGASSSWEKRQWLKSRLMQLEEQRVSYHWQAFELEKQRLKWVKFSSKKERDMERAKLKNERMRLDNERMVLLLRKKEVELLDLHQQQQQQSSNKRGDPSSNTG